MIKFSKKELLIGYQCPQKLFLYRQNNAPLHNPLTPYIQQKVLVQSLVRSIFKTGRFDAKFESEWIEFTVDILQKNENGGWDLYDIKSGIEIVPNDLVDVALQTVLLEEMGTQIDNAMIICLNSNYSRVGEINAHTLFKFATVTPELPAYQKKIKEKLPYIVELNEISRPSKSSACFLNGGCEYKKECWSDIPDYSVFDIKRLRISKRFDLYDQGYIKITDIPNHYPLPFHQQAQVDSEKFQRPIINQSAIHQFLNQLEYPLFFLDFETWTQAIPLYQNCKPFQPLPFLFSLHYQLAAEAPVQHTYFMADPNQDSRLAMLKHLLSHWHPHGSVLVYGMETEHQILSDFASAFPQYEVNLSAMRKSLLDLGELFKKKAVYYPQMQGSYRLKVIVNHFFPDQSYDNLTIKNGYEAVLAYFQRQKFDELIQYCHHDTWAMVALLDKLKQFV